MFAVSLPPYRWTSQAVVDVSKRNGPLTVSGDQEEGFIQTGCVCVSADESFRVGGMLGWDWCTMCGSEWFLSREYWMISRGPGFPAVLWLGSLPTPSHPSPFSNLSLFISLPVCRRSSLRRLNSERIYLWFEGWKLVFEVLESLWMISRDRSVNEF